MATATYMRFGSVGVKTAYQKYVAEATGNGDYEMANNLLSTGSAVMLVISVIALIPAAYFSRHLAKFAGVPPEFLSSAAGAITLLALIMMMSNVGAAFEAIVAGALRGDLTRKLITVLSFAEAVTIILLLHLGFGLFAMAAVMGASELFYITGCFVQSRRVVPQVRLALRWVKTSVLYELFRFAGSYQLVNLLEVVYASIVPFAVLRAFGADSAGVYGVVSRVVTSAAMLLDAFLPQILSGGTLVYTLGAAERMQKLLTKAFKVTLGLSLLPMGFIAVFGPTLAYAWTGEVHPLFRVAFWLVSLTGVFRAFSLLSLVLYRVSGNAVLDNIRQVLRIAIILAVACFARRIGFLGVLGGLAIAELVGMIFMLFALSHTFHAFHPRLLVPDAVRVTGAAVLIFGAGMLASYVPLPGDHAGRAAAALKLGEICVAVLLVAWPALRGTGSVTPADVQALFWGFLSHGKTAATPIPQ